MYPSATLGAFDGKKNKIVVFKFDNLDDTEFYSSNFKRACKIVKEENGIIFEIKSI